MARGYPDYFGMSIFPKFGTFTEEIITDAATPDTETSTLFNVVAKARIYSLIIRIFNADSLAGIGLTMTIDGTTFVQYNIIDLLNHRLGVAGGYPLKVSLFDVVGKQCTIVGAAEITIEQSFKLDILNVSGGAINHGGLIHYARVI